MKSFIAILAVIMIVAAVFYCCRPTTAPLSEVEFRKSEQYLNKRIDSLKAMIIYLGKNQDTIKKDLDTLKGGQRIIFDEVKKKSDINFWSLF